MDISLYQHNRSQFPVDELRTHDRQWVAFSADGSRIIAAAERLADLEEQIITAGEDPQRVGFEWIEFEDSSLGGAEWL